MVTALTVLRSGLSNNSCQEKFRSPYSLFNWQQQCLVSPPPSLVSNGCGGTLSLGLKWPGHEAGHSPPASAKVKEVICTASLPGAVKWKRVTSHNSHGAQVGNTGSCLWYEHLVGAREGTVTTCPCTLVVCLLCWK
jgi:hypothetical protein